MLIQDRKRNCLRCSKEFTPRLYQIKTGNGKYCSVACRNAAFLPLLMTKESKKKSKDTYRENIAKGFIQHPSGENHPRWKGGQKATTQRRIASGKANDSQKNYRAKNPDKLREWSATRNNRKTGRLPKGTVKSIGSNQKWLCVYCKTDVLIKYHVDHIIPLAKGGKHIPSNIQILCPTCNVRKSAKLNYEHSII